MGLRAFFGKHELFAVGLICLVILLIAAGSLISTYKPFGTAYEDLSVSYKQEGDFLSVTESFHARDGKSSSNVVYRSFAETVCKDGCDFMIDDVTCQLGTPYYAIDSGKPLNPNTGNTVSVSKTYKIQKNEAGCYSNSGYGGKNEVLTLTYHIPLNHVKLNKYNHILFSEAHLAVNKLEITGLSGSSTYSYFPQNKRLTINVQTGEVTSTGTPFFLLLLIVFAVATIPYWIWKVFGKEKDFVVPQYMHTLPNKNMEAWKVDVFINGTNQLSKNGMASLLMELYAANALEVKETKKFMGKHYLFYIKKNYGQTKISAKAKAFVSKLEQYKTEETADTFVCKMPSSTDRSFSLFMQDFFQKGNVQEFVQSILDLKGLYIVGGISVVLGIVVYAGAQFFGGAAGFFIFGVVVLIFLLTMMPKTVFARFKGDYYKQYLEWHAFSNMLKDYAQVKKYLKEDYVIWKEWLIYATALGVADNVMKSLKELRVLNDAQYNHMSHMHSQMLLVSAIAFSSGHPRGNSGGTGGIGGGGGFGGGGGGFR